MSFRWALSLHRRLEERAIQVDDRGVRLMRDPAYYTGGGSSPLHSGQGAGVNYWARRAKRSVRCEVACRWRGRPAGACLLAGAVRRGRGDPPLDVLLAVTAKFIHCAPVTLMEGIMFLCNPAVCLVLQHGRGRRLCVCVCGKTKDDTGRFGGKLH